MSLNRRGAALAELLVGAVLTAALTTTALDALGFLQRTVVRQVARTAAAHNLRAAVQLFAAELQDLSPADGDLMALSAGSLTYRGVRGTGLACGSSAAGLHILAATFRVLRQPVAGRDSLLLVRPAAPIVVAITGDPGPGVCPDGRAAVVIPSAAVSDSLWPGWPALVRVTEVMELRAYPSGAEWWLGLRSIGAGEVVQPALGPLAPAGLVMTGLDSLGGIAASVAEVHQLDLAVHLASGDSIRRTLALGRGWP